MQRREGNRPRGRWAQLALALLTAFTLALSINACGGSGDARDVTLTIGSRGTPEEEVLGHIYAQALSTAGYEVHGHFGLDTAYRDVPQEELQAGRISGYPEHLNAALQLGFGVADEALPSNPQKAYEMAKSKFESEGLTAFRPTPYSLSRPVGLLKKTAEERNLKTVSDLKGQAEEMTLLGFEDCHFRLDCLAGIELYYHTNFESISYMYSPKQISQRYQALEDGKFDAATLYSTDGRLATDRDRFVILEDDKHVFPAGNTIFVTSRKAVREAGPAFERTIVAAQKGLTLPVMQQLDAEVELEKKRPAEVAARYLRQVGMAG
jgi:osmoprotectant transport system substrate-binding protein